MSGLDIDPLVGPEGWTVIRGLKKIIIFLQKFCDLNAKNQGRFILFAQKHYGPTRGNQLRSDQRVDIKPRTWVMK